MSKSNRYTIENLPVSPETLKALSQDGINLLVSIGRFMSMQDDVYDDQFSEVLKAIDKQDRSSEQLLNIINKQGDLMQQIVERLSVMEGNINGIKKDVAGLRAYVKKEVSSIQKNVASLADRLETVEKEVELIKQAMKEAG